MRPFETLDSVVTPEGRRLSLHRHDRDFAIHLDGEELMTTWVHGSEDALATLSLAELPPVPRPRVLIGGLGLGFTLRAALAALPAAAEVRVAEIFPRVVEWHRTHLQPLAAPLGDPRVRILTADVADLVDGSRPGAFHAVLLDVDNGPSAWCLEANARLYDRAGVERLRRALAPGGVLGVWSAFRDPAFVKRLRSGGFSVEARTVRARGRKGSRHTLFLARRGAGQSKSRVEK